GKYLRRGRRRAARPTADYVIHVPGWNDGAGATGSSNAVSEGGFSLSVVGSQSLVVGISCNGMFADDQRRTNDDDSNVVLQESLGTHHAFPDRRSPCPRRIQS